jgi:hypothetical protein
MRCLKPNAHSSYNIDYLIDVATPIEVPLYRSYQALSTTKTRIDHKVTKNYHWKLF